MTATQGAQTLLAEEDQLRADMYDLLAALLARPPSAALLARCAALSAGAPAQPHDDPESPQARVAAAFRMLAERAAAVDEKRAAREHTDLFIGVGRGELLPYASYYLTGFLNEKPLASLRGDMMALGVARAEGVSEPEDHIASVCDIMAGLIRGRFRAPASIAQQRDFFNRHVAPWAGHFFSDLENAVHAGLYEPVGALGAAFVEIEKTGFRLEA